MACPINAYDRPRLSNFLDLNPPSSRDKAFRPRDTARNLRTNLAHAENASDALRRTTARSAPPVPSCCEKKSSRNVLRVCSFPPELQIKYTSRPAARVASHPGLCSFPTLCCWKRGTFLAASQALHIRRNGSICWTISADESLWTP